MMLDEAFEEMNERQPKMPVMYQEKVDYMRTKNPSMLRFMSIAHKNLNQLRILIELHKISEQELRYNKFDRNRYA